MFPPHVPTGQKNIEGMLVERAETLVKTNPEHARREYCRHESRTASEYGVAGPRVLGESCS